MNEIDQKNLHPMNRDPGSTPPWQAPGWTPPSYPPAAEFPQSDLPMGVTPEEFAKEAARVAKQYPTLASYLKLVYTTWLEEDKTFLGHLEPKRIAAPGGYLSPRCATASLFSTLSQVTIKMSHNMRVMPTEISALLLAYAVVHQRVPTYYVSDALVRAVAATELPSDFTLQDLHWPMPALVLGFPDAFMREYTGREIGYVFAADLPEGDYAPPSWTQDLPTISCPAKISLQFHAYTLGVLDSYVTGWLASDPVASVIGKYTYVDYTQASDKKVSEDKLVNEKVQALVLKLLVVLNIRPKLVDMGQIKRPAKINQRTGKVEQKELWTPNFIGLQYQAQRQEVAQGAHASPRFHWRIGHITHQRIGNPKASDFVSIGVLPRAAGGEIDWVKVSPETRDAFWRCHERRWLEPVLVNFEESTP